MKRWRRYCECAIRGPSFASTLLNRVRQLPTINLAKLIEGRPLLIVAPHPDDETLGCGGIIAETTRLGGKVHIVVVTDGAGSHPASRTHPQSRLRSLRRSETLEAAEVLGVPAEQVSFFDVPDGYAPQFGSNARTIGEKLTALAHHTAAGLIFTTWNYDMHSDHVAAYRYARVAAEKVAVPLFSYPIWAWMLPPSALMPNLHIRGFSVDIEHSLMIKQAAISKHISQTTSLISDDPVGFTLSSKDLATMITAKEFFIASNDYAYLL